MSKPGRVVAYVTHGDRLLVFRHTGFPEAGVQVPGGSVMCGETLEQAVMRETAEETGLTDIEIRAYLGAHDLDLTQYGLPGSLTQHFFHLQLRGEPPATWLHYEMDPSDGSPAPIEFEFYWVDLSQGIPELAGGQGEMLSVLRTST